jgi:hypothetical protein
VYSVVSSESRVFGLYQDFVSLRSCVDRLKALHFGNNDISVLFPEAAVSNDLSSPPASSASAAKSPVAFIGGTLGSLTYIRPEKIGIISAALVDLGVPEREAELYEGSLRDGSLLACVRSSVARCVESAVEALMLTGAERVIAAGRSSSPRIPVANGLSVDRDRFSYSS